jgi:glycosyltransferase involved in cell wall biosynthesis
LTKQIVSLSVVVPVYAGEAYLRRLVELLEVIRSDWSEIGAPFELAEVILVDDCAVDSSPELIDTLAAEHDWIVPLHLMRNFGQHPATIAGILHSSGDWVVTMDEDLQHPPKDIEAMLRHAVTTGSDIVYAKPADDVHQSKLRDWASRGFKGALAVLTGNRHVRDFNSFRLIRGPLARAASSVVGHETYFDVALSWYTERVTTIQLSLKDHRFIQSGESGYNFRKLLSHARKLIISSQFKFIRGFGLLGIFVVALSILGFLWIFILKFSASEIDTPTGWPSIMVSIFFFGGFITLILAMIVEFLVTLVLSANGKPIFFTVDRSSDTRIARYFSETQQ